MKRLICICVVLFMAGYVAARPVIPPDDFYDGWKRSGERVKFAGSDLYGHIDGGAELFLEFGFEQLVVQRYARGEQEIDLEIYQMDSPEGALGIYLMKCGKEKPVEGINARNTGSSSQLTIVKNRYFIQVNSFIGDDALLPVMVTMANITLEKIPEGVPITLFGKLSQRNLVPGSESIIRGRYSLQPIYTFGSGDILSLEGRAFGVVADYADSNISYTCILVPYPGTKKAEEAYAHLVKNLDRELQVTRKWKDGFAFKDFNGEYGRVALKDRYIELLIHLKNAPLE